MLGWIALAIIVAIGVCAVLIVVGGAMNHKDEDDEG